MSFKSQGPDLGCPPPIPCSKLSLRTEPPAKEARVTVDLFYSGTATVCLSMGQELSIGELARSPTS